jgi:hypothetical protein
MQRMSDALNLLCKWRTVLAGWHGGTASLSQPGVSALRDEADHRLVMRAEVNALTGLLVAKGVFTIDEFQDAITKEAITAEVDLQRRFPGFKATTIGIDIYDIDLANRTMAKNNFPP